MQIPDKPRAHLTNLLSERIMRERREAVLNPAFISSFSLDLYPLLRLADHSAIHLASVLILQLFIRFLQRMERLGRLLNPLLILIRMH